ncbi:glycosyltransferase family 2 protein [Mucilaginibacter pocheonensis]|uniref:Glycosyltransferase involved in cell wall biosynthesis n=1 Tax=Mucilaginibacter pocheonensis TaxID=398050 RepID=A0ABU1T733_9SPHI|nr:glycosyltransferase [Mucilaginibacter pocheonensis]MDR6941174.1 glycosyltransferase involved in cell wall biosynthesis [Mucilaginibacter pocheonensis]
MPNDLTIAIPTYNRNDYLIKILNTIPHDKKVIVGDNGGAVTEDIISQYPGFSFLRPDKKLDMFENWNFCIDHVKTQWFIIPSDDDLYYPDAFNKIEDALDNYPDADIILFGHRVINEHDTILSTWAPASVNVFEKPKGYDYFKYGVEARLPSIIFKTSVAKSYGLFDESYVYTAADSLLIQKCMLYGKAVVLPHIISGYRVWPDNFTNRYVSSADWLAKIDKWQTEILQHAKIVYEENNLTIQPAYIKDEVYAGNLLAGVANKKAKSGFKDTLAFVKSVRFPWKAKLTTQMKIIKALLIG